MKNNYSIAERNRIVEEHLWCIDRVIRKNRSLMRAARPVSYTHLTLPTILRV